MEEGFVNIALYVAYTLLGLAVISAVLLPLINAFDNPRNLVKMGGGLVLMGVVFLIGYAIAGNEVTESYANAGVGPELSKFVGGELNLMFILIGIALVGIIFTELSKIFK